MENEKTTFEMKRISTKSVTVKLVLDSYHAAFINTLKLLRQINDTLPQLAATHLGEARGDLARRIEELDSKGKKQLGRYEEYIKNEKKRKVVIKHKEAVKLHRERMDLSFFSLRIPQFIREMSLVYLVASFEGYLSDIVKLTFRLRKEMLKTSQKNITYEEAISYPDLDSLLDGIIEKEVKELLNGDIDKISKTLTKRFKSLNLEEDEEVWQRFKEYFIRRNIIVHNYGIPDSTYNLKTKSNKDQTKRLLVEQVYLNEGFELFDSCALMLLGYFINFLKAK
jgi:hypothetical protein